MKHLYIIALVFSYFSIQAQVENEFEIGITGAIFFEGGPFKYDDISRSLEVLDATSFGYLSWNFSRIHEDKHGWLFSYNYGRLNNYSYEGQNLARTFSMFSLKYLRKVDVIKWDRLKIFINAGGVYQAGLIKSRFESANSFGLTTGISFKIKVWKNLILSNHIDYGFLFVETKSHLRHMISIGYLFKTDKRSIFSRNQ